MGILSIINLPLAVSSSLLISIGILVIYSSSKELGLQQAAFALVGILGYLFVSYLDYRSLRNVANFLYIGVIILLLFVLLLGIETRGAVRWIPLGLFNLQPSEFAKPALILILANLWTNNAASWLNIGKSLLITLPVAFLINRQPDLGSALTIMAIWFGMLFASRISLKKIILILLIAILFIPVGWLTLHQYQKQRIVSFLSPESDPLGVGYNLIQSTIAVGSGGVFGWGLGRGTQSRLQFLPEFRTDFIFASIAEEMGFIGSLIILGIYLFMIIYSIRVSNLTDPLGNLIIFGVSSMLLFQVMVNIGMNIGLLPITGITLPLISYGGSSVVSTLFSLGFISSIARYRAHYRSKMELLEKN